MAAQPLIVAIDGGSGVGKSTVARLLAQKLNCLYVDSGTHYRAVTHLLQKDGVPYTNAAGIAKKLEHWVLDEIIEDGVGRILINHQAFSEGVLRAALVNAEVSYYAAVPAVRAFLLFYERSQAEVALHNDFEGVVMDGRDIALNVFPQTPYKYFLTASAEVKAQRRAADGLVDITEKRDEIDCKLGQLRRAENAVVVDTTSLSAEEVLVWLLNDIASRLA